ncbi:antibiotic biosynthesis monooxygenase family protein [Acinetobacter sp. NigerLNRRAM0016]
MNYVVIFKAKIKALDEAYFKTAQALREKALTQFNCQKFEAISEQDFEIALSYWNHLTGIQAWHRDAEHQVAQQLGKQQWYQSFSVEICKIEHHYASTAQMQ